MRTAPTFLRPSSLRSKAHCCLHCSHVCGGPYFFSELVQRWHLVPMKAAMMLQYWQGLGWKTNAHENNVKCNTKEKVRVLDLTISYRSKLFNILGTFLTDRVGFTAKKKREMNNQFKIKHGRCRLNHCFGNGCIMSYLSCWNSDLQNVHFTIGCAIRHSCSNNKRECHLLKNYTILKGTEGNNCNCKSKMKNNFSIIQNDVKLVFRWS